MKKIGIGKYKYYLFALIISFIALLFTSENSFLYQFNDWVDANAFFTVGKSMMNGVIPYKDLFEQKGPFLYLIYGIGYLFTHKSFHGVFILEVFSFSIFMYYIYKIIKLYLDEKYSLVILPIMAYIITTSTAFAHGGSCEEFAFPYMAISLYYFIKHFKISPLTNKEIIINGVMAGIILMMKYTMLGLWIGFGLFMFIDYLRKKKIKDGILFCLKFLLGMAIPFIIGVIYFIIVGGLKDFIKDYFIINITLYSNNTSILARIIGMIKGLFQLLKLNGKIVLLLVALYPIFVLCIKGKDYYLKISLIGIMFLTTFFITWGLVFYIYYILPLFIFILISLIGIISIISKYIDKILDKKIFIIISMIIMILSLGLCYTRANYKEYKSYKKDHYFQYKYAEYINKYKNPTLLNMGSLDAGLYTTTGIIPNTRFFEVQNIEYDRFKDNLDEMKKNVENKDVKFILYYRRADFEEVPEYIYNNYELVYDDEYIFEEQKFIAYLFKLKDLKE